MSPMHRWIPTLARAAALGLFLLGLYILAAAVASLLLEVAP